MKNLIQRANEWLNAAPPFARYAVAFGGLLGCAIVTTLLSTLIKTLLRGW